MFQIHRQSQILVTKHQKNSSRCEPEALTNFGKAIGGAKFGTKFDFDKIANQINNLNQQLEMSKCAKVTLDRWSNEPSFCDGPMVSPKWQKLVEMLFNELQLPNSQAQLAFYPILTYQAS